jgi:hypothetical protein
MARELFIVSRDRPDLFRYLAETFAGVDNLDIIWDRRAGERRVQHSQSTPDRRLADRRTELTVDADLRAVGYAFVAPK